MLTVAFSQRNNVRPQRLNASTAYQTLPIVEIAFLEDNSAFVSYILSLFDKRYTIFNRVRKVVDLNRNSGHQCFHFFRCKYRSENGRKSNPV